MEMGTGKIILKKYPAKLLLFGEYSVIEGGDALALPYPDLIGSFSTESTTNQKEVHGFLDYLIARNFEFLDEVKLKMLRENVTGTASNIPVGYGVGSSGVITAAAYDFCKINHGTTLAELKTNLGQMEDFFHGESSGFDPLICYTQKLTHLAQGQIIQKEISNTFIPDNLNIYLLNTHISRRTEPLVKLVKSKLQESSFKKEFAERYTISQNQAIHFFLEDDINNLQSALYKISRYQFDEMNFLIPDKFKKFWKSGLETKNYTCKLCGAGGGGFILVFSQKNLNLNQFKKFKIQEINKSL